MKCGHLLLGCLFLHPCFHDDGQDGWSGVIVTDSVVNSRHEPPTVVITNALPSSDGAGGQISSADVPAFWSVVPAGRINVEVKVAAYSHETIENSSVQLFFDERPVDRSQFQGVQPAAEINADGRVVTTFQFGFDCPSPGHHILQARYLKKNIWSQLSPPLHFRVLIAQRPQIISVSDVDAGDIGGPLTNEPVKITGDTLRIRLARVGQNDLISVYLDGKKLNDGIRSGDACCVTVNIANKFVPGIHDLTVRAIPGGSECALASPPSESVKIHYFDEDVYLLRPGYHGCDSGSGQCAIGNKSSESYYNVVPTYNPIEVLPTFNPEDVAPPFYSDELTPSFNPDNITPPIESDDVAPPPLNPDDIVPPLIPDADESPFEPDPAPLENQTNATRRSTVVGTRLVQPVSYNGIQEVLGNPESSSMKTNQVPDAEASNASQQLQDSNQTTTNFEPTANAEPAILNSEPPSQQYVLNECIDTNAVIAAAQLETAIIRTGAAKENAINAIALATQKAQTARANALANAADRIDLDLNDPKDKDAAKRTFHFAAPAFFPRREFGPRGQLIEREGVVIYEDMAFRFDQNGKYAIEFRASTADVPANLALQFQVQSSPNGPWYTLTMPRRIFEPNTEEFGMPSQRFEGTSEVLKRCFGTICDIRRTGSARFGFGVAGLGHLNAE